VPAGQVVEIPEHATFQEAAAVPVNYLTAYHMLFRVASLRPGMRVLVHMAAGGVGIAVLQLCRTVEGVVTFGTSSASKHDVLRAEGCTHPIDYRTTDYAARVRELTDGEGVDLVLDPLGGRDWRKGLKLLRPVGQLIAYGFANLTKGERRSVVNLARQASGVPMLTPVGLMDRNHTVSGVNIGHLWKRVDVLRGELDALLELWRAGDIKPRIDAVFPFVEAAQAHRRITERRNIGKVILVP
jgi:NADPH:quinone reductase-like Zn-dependent oxidoreductase